MKRGQISWEQFLSILLAALEVLLVVTIVVGIVYVVTKGKAEPEEKDFKRVLDATDSLIENFEDKKIQTNAYLTVPMMAEMSEIIFYRPKDPASPDKCRGQTCICMTFYIKGNPKTTCKTIETPIACTPGTCGEELCAGPATRFIVKEKENVRVSIDCIEGSSRLSVQKA